MWWKKLLRLEKEETNAVVEDLEKRERKDLPLRRMIQK